MLTPRARTELVIKGQLSHWPIASHPMGSHQGVRVVLAETHLKKVLLKHSHMWGNRLAVYSSSTQEK